MFDNQTFQSLVEADHLTGEVVASNSFIIEVKGLEGVTLGAQVLFEDGQRGLVREAYGDQVILFNIDSEKMEPGTLAVVENDLLSVPVGKGLVGRVISPMGMPLDGKGAIRSQETSGIFNPAPGIMARSMLNEQLASGVSAVDMFFPVVLGQRIAILGDSKSGKSTFLSQLSANQAGTDRIVVYVLIGKRKVDIESLLAGLQESGAMDHTIVVLADIFDSLTQSYLAPYAACAMAESLWYGGQDVVIIYDDLSSHAEAYRQLSLLQEVDPGRDSYPGDMFYAHSSLLERAGKLLDGNKTLTALPVIITPNDDITAYLSTSIMSITDGQIIFDLGVFRQGVRPAVNAGLSVSRVGGQAQTVRQKRLSGNLFKKLAKYHQAEEFSHFGSSLSKDASIDLMIGKQIYEAIKQPAEERHSLVEQQLILETILLGAGEAEIDVPALKLSAKEVSSQAKDEKDFDRLEAELLKKHSSAVEPVAAPDATPPPSDKPVAAQPEPPKPSPPPATKTEEKAHAKS
ncbi:MAG TPA: sodium-transporting two-sector ATPase [Candidatus Dormibacteraeota bacterium]|nr:sodium-transporting two-sector ATPase [Candidatus Dormibacteraeota bacterium]